MDGFKGIGYTVKKEWVDWNFILYTAGAQCKSLSRASFPVLQLLWVLVATSSRVHPPLEKFSEPGHPEHAGGLNTPPGDTCSQYIVLTL